MSIQILFFLTTFLSFSSASADPTTSNIPLRDLDGNFLELPQANTKASVLYFADANCPVANAYIPRINELYSEYESQGIQFLVVYVEGNTPWTVARHKNDFKVEPPIVIDFDNQLYRRLKPKVMGQVIVLKPDLSVSYSGRVDDQFAVGQRKPEATTHELRDVIQSLGAGRPPKTESVAASGCGLNPGPDISKAQKLTYTKDIAPIIKTNCSACHQEKGTAPFSLSNYAEVSRLAPALALVLREYRMPPWFSDTKPDAFSHPTTLPIRDRQRLLSWIDQGALRGEGKEHQAPKPRDGWKLGKPDHIIDVPGGQSIPSSGKNVFREFAIDLKRDKDLWIQKVDFETEFPKAVHHVVVYTRRKGWDKLTEQSADRWGYFAGFVPGSGPTVLPEGIAKRIPHDHELVVNIHYVPMGREIVDRSKIALYFSKTTRPQELFTDSVRELDINIPPGARRFKIVAEREMKEDIIIRSIVPHAHYRGKSFLVTALAPDGTSRELLSVPNYTFTWQSTYTYRNPIRLSKGTKIRCEVQYDNSKRNPQNPDPSVSVVFGPLSEDEMMFCYYDYQRVGLDKNGIALRTDR
ncbi:MAG: redoxin domain-containing protein [Bdellovibrionales bacterium]|nr:redoxin domain-containing protein [Bdellovibrionales bacterium]